MMRTIINMKEMNELMGRLRRLLDMRITFFDLQELELDALDIKSLSHFCAYWRQGKERCKLCTACDRKHIKKAKELGDVHIYHCHAGLIEGIVPLYDHRHIYLGAIVFGQLRDPSIKAQSDWNPELKNFYRQLPAATFDRVQDVGNLLKALSEYIVSRELVRFQNRPWAETLESYIEQHLSEKISTKMLARHIKKSSSFVAHHFKAEFGQTPRQYIIRRRMEEARTMIENGRSIQEVADRLGFYDAFHFSKTFKRFWGKSPSRFLPK